MPRNRPFVLNVDTKVVHRKPTREECNVDDAVHKRNASLVPASYRKCQHCFAESPAVQQ